MCTVWGGGVWPHEYKGCARTSWRGIQSTRRHRSHHAIPLITHVSRQCSGGWEVQGSVTNRTPLIIERSVKVMWWSVMVWLGAVQRFCVLLVDHNKDDAKAIKRLLYETPLSAWPPQRTISVIPARHKAYSHQRRINSSTKWANNLVWIVHKNQFSGSWTNWGTNWNLGVDTPIGSSALVQFLDVHQFVRQFVSGVNRPIASAVQRGGGVTRRGRVDWDWKSFRNIKKIDKHLDLIQIDSRSI